MTGASCPRCGRPVALVRPHCLYCGGALPPELVAAAEAAAEAAQAPLGAAAVASVDAAGGAAAGTRQLLILDLSGAEAGALERGLAVSAYEAGQRLKRGGYQLLRILASAAEAQRELDRLAGHGLRAVALPEAETHGEPLLVTGGRLLPGRLDGRSENGRFEWAAEDLLLVVKGPIRRQLQAQGEGFKRLRVAAPDDGYRFHVHRRGDPRPLELDPDRFEFEAERAAAGSTLLRIASWLDATAPKPLVDDGFRLLPPALGEAETRDDTALALGRDPAARPAGLLLDNLRQFRAYSAWRGALERRARG